RIWRPRRRADGPCEAFDGRGSTPRLTQTTTCTRSYMNRDFKTRVDRDAPLESLAAELTLAAYRIALRTRTGGTWLDLEYRARDPQRRVRRDQSICPRVRPLAAVRAGRQRSKS